MKFLLSFFFFFFLYFTFSQQTKVKGVVYTKEKKEPVPFALVYFKDSKISIETDTSGFFNLETYYATPQLIIDAYGFQRKIVDIVLDSEQEITILLEEEINQLEEVIVKAPDEFPSTKLHKRVITYKAVNNKEKFSSYEYEVYNKVQLDINNVGGNVIDRTILKKVDILNTYIDSNESKAFLPAILSETISDFYFKKNPKLKKEVVKATYISGVSSLQMNQFLGDMYIDINIYDNQIPLFNQSFVSPLANYARTFYKFYLEDSSFIENKWCYKLTFKPKRSSDLTFEGEMWIHDTTYAVKSFSARMSKGVNLNYVHDFYIEQEFEQIRNEIWMQKSEKMIADIRLTDKSKLNGIIGRKYTSRRNIKVNEDKPNDFYSSKFTVELTDDAKNKSEEYWHHHRHDTLSTQEKKVLEMIDTLNNLRIFKLTKNLMYMSNTAYYPIGKIEIGKTSGLYSRNPVEDNRFGLSIRTSNQFSNKVEFGIKGAYGTLDKKFKYGATFRYNVTPEKRGMLSVYYNYDIEQIGVSPYAYTVGSSFGNLFRTGPLDKLTFVSKYGLNFEKDIKKDIVLFFGFENKEYTALGLANYLKYNSNTDVNDTINKIKATELIARFRWTKDEEFITGTFDRTTLRSRFPVFSIQGIFGIKGFLGSDYEYQKLEVRIDHKMNGGIFGRMNYGIYVGKIFGTMAYPFLKVHEANQTYWLMTSTFNMMNFFEFVSDEYVGAYTENHWGGLFFDAIPFIQKAKIRVVSSARIVHGDISSRHSKEMILPEFTKNFGKIPYAEASVGLENIFKLVRIDCFYRITHQIPGVNPFGIRGRLTFNF